MNQSSLEQQTREFFQRQAASEGISLRAYCKKYGIIYESFFGRDDYEDVPGGKIYLSQIDSMTIAEEDHKSSNDPSE